MSSRHVEWQELNARRPPTRARSADKAAYFGSVWVTDLESISANVAEDAWDLPKEPGFCSPTALTGATQITEWLSSFPLELSILRTSLEAPEEQAVESAWEKALQSLKADVLVETDPARRSGVPVLRGTRFPLSRVFQELADDHTLSDIANDYDLDLELLRRIVQAVATFSDRLPDE